MPKEDLSIAGYTKERLIDYHIRNNKEYMTFSDWTTPEYEDAITIIIENDKVVDWFKEEGAR